MTATIQLFSPINSIPFLVGARAGAAALTNTATTTTASWSTSNGLTVSLTGKLGDITVAAGDPAGSGNKLVVMLGSHPPARR